MSVPDRARRAQIAAIFITAACGLSACSTDGSRDMFAGIGDAHPTDSSSADSDKQDHNVSGPSPLGDANKEMKTQRPPAPARLMVTNMRIGQHPGFERVVFDLEGEGQPGWFVDFQDQPTQQGSGKRINYYGATALNVNIDGTVLPYELGKDDPALGTMTGYGSLITEVTSAGTFEGRSQFIIGLDQAHPYSVEVLDNPKRVVIDILDR
ncbi:AMIN-like domain-containing (lipo)protein [Corynebacterium sp. 32222D000AT]|uniref:AMIN-like domain-containing (lipo)protein n=1 Tax=unclassified Corynebacterium TaxID=2624378 RepID=UPI002A9EA0C9|nr:hypothetical protein [Mycobacteriaceae bacterium]MDY5828329.1 hypothetical protein [Corynebacterium sp.]